MSFLHSIPRLLRAQQSEFTTGLGAVLLMTALILLPSALVGCKSGGGKAPGGYADLAHDDGLVVQGATRRYVETNDRGAIPYLIENLVHEDQWIRRFTNIALHELTHNRVVLPSGLSDDQERDFWRAWYKNDREQFFNEALDDSLKSSGSERKN